MKVAKAKCHVVRMIGKPMMAQVQKLVGEVQWGENQGKLTELSIVKDMLVEQDNTGTQGDPDADCS